MHSRYFGAAALGLALMTAPLTALAQTAPAPAPAPGAPATAQNFSEEKLRSFAVAFLEVDKINQEYAPRLQGASSAEEQQQIRQEATGKMLEAVEGADGISTDEYTQILTAAQADPELATQLNEAIGQAAR